MNDFSLSFVGIGPQRTGTTWLYAMLQDHPALCFPQDVKETMFFDLYFEKGLDWYFKHFKHKQHSQLCGEIVSTYFDVNAVPQRIRVLNPNCKIIINLRNPVDRAFSLYLHHRSKGRVSGTFSESIQQMPRIIHSGKYTQHVPRWFDTFGEDRVLFILFEDIRSSPEAVLNNICCFLGIDEIEKPPDAEKKINAARLPRFPWLAKNTASLVTRLHAYRLHKIVELGKRLGLQKVYTGYQNDMPELTDDERLLLRQEFDEDIAFVEGIVGRDLSAWRNAS